MRFVAMNFCFISLQLMLAGCHIVGPERIVEVLAPSNKVELTTLTPRHYKAAEHCVQAIEIAPKSLLASIEPLTSSQQSQLQWPDRLKSYRTNHCKSFKRRGAILRDIEDIFASKTQRIGVILPPPSSSEPALQIILDQMKTELVAAGYSPDKTLLVRRAGKERSEALRSAAELAHLEKVAMIVGGLTPSHASAIATIADQSQTPALIISPHAHLGRTAQSMRVYPPIKRLARRLAESFKSQDVKTVAALFPAGANTDLYQILRQQLGGGFAYSQATYNPDKPQSVLDAVKSQTGRLSDTNGRPAVLILDNFRMVRHIVNILSTSLPGKNILFAGNQQWRSPALVIPREDSLQGAVFVDFIGNYRNLPRSIETPLSDNDYFTTAQAASKIDYQIIGHRLGSLASEAARFGLNRYEIARRLQSMNNKWDSYFPKTENAFDSERESSWPVFMFRVVDDSIEEI